MNPLISAWNALDGRQKTVMAISVAAALAAMVLIWRMAAAPNHALLFAGLDPAAAGEVVAALEQRSVSHQVRGNAIYVDAEQRDATRLALAAEGLPATGGVGYELLDTMTGFGTTAQMFDAAYWRAKEGELARTILASREVRAARVHIATPARQPFARPVPVTASVTLTPASGSISAPTAEAIRNLVASAVAGLSAADVALIDSANGVIAGPGGQPGMPVTGSPDRRAAQMKANLERLLAARVGPGKALVEVYLDTDLDSQRITERVVDPTSRVAISTELEERTDDSSGTSPGAVTVASNLPGGDAEAGGGSNSSSVSETMERQNYEISETRRERVIQPGQIRKISVAVILDGITTVAADGSRSWAPRPDAEMTALRELVESAIGFDAARGDRVTLQTLEFPALPDLGTAAATPSAFSLTGGVLSLIQTAILAVVALLLGLFVVRPLLARPPALPAPGADAVIDLVGETVPPDPVAVAPPEDSQDPVTQRIRSLRSVIEERSDDSADVLRRWIEAPEIKNEAV